MMAAYKGLRAVDPTNLIFVVKKFIFVVAADYPVSSLADFVTRSDNRLGNK